MGRLAIANASVIKTIRKGVNDMSNEGIVFPGKGEISKIVVSTALGTSGGGIFPHTLRPGYKKFLRIVNSTGTTIITKSMTRFSRRGNFNLKDPRTWRFIQKFGNCSMLNAYGLTNEGVVSVAEKISENICRNKANIIPNLYPEFAKGEEIAIKEILSSIRMLIATGVPIWAIELNLSCPNSKEQIADNMKMSTNCIMAVKSEFPNLIVIAKTSIVHPFSFYRQLEDAGTDVIHGINTIPYELLYYAKTSPLADVGGGGVSGEAAFSRAKSYLSQLRKETTLPIIMGCGVTSCDAVKEMLLLGANSVSICTLALIDSELARKILKVYN